MASLDYSLNKDLGLFHSFWIYLSFAFLLFTGHFHDLIDACIGRNQADKKKGYAPLISEFEAFYTRRLYSRIEDCWNRPITGTPGAWIDVLERKQIDKVWKSQSYFTGKTRRCLNLSSYNYLGFATNKGPILESVVASVKKYGLCSTSARIDLGTNPIHIKAEKLTAEFVGKEDAIIFGMGYATNSTTIPALVGKGDLIVSDALNHASLVFGCRSSGATIKVFKHNDLVDLERILQEAIWKGQSHPPRPWRRILILIEGIYSMEGEVCRLPQIVSLKKKYKAYLYVDEAHSIGALGDHARGVCDYFNISPKEVDILMGTFTKSFGSVGGYIAADKDIIDFLRARSYGQIYETSMASGCVQQAYGALQCIMGLDSTDIGIKKIRQLKENSNYFRKALLDLGFYVFGDPDSPIIPLMLYYPAKIPCVSRDCFSKNIATVVVGFPATPISESRIRFCISASHTKQDLDWAVHEFTQTGRILMLDYNLKPRTHLSPEDFEYPVSSDD